MKLLSLSLSRLLCEVVLDSFQQIPECNGWITCVLTHKKEERLLYHPSLPSATNEDSPCSTSTPLFDAIIILNFSLSNRCICMYLVIRIAFLNLKSHCVRPLFKDFPLEIKINLKGLTHKNLHDLASTYSYLFCFLNKIHAEYFIFLYHLIIWYQPDHDYHAVANFFLSFFKYARLVPIKGP